MDIPYTVHARPDTGLYNAKVGIWLFLASEVMLFGGLFSSYIFLRLGADYPWPIHELRVDLGCINTVVLIASSVTVVWAWAAAKMRQFARCQLLLAITVICAATFMVNKFFEYKAKFEHYSVTLTDGSILSGHLENGYQIEFGEVKELSLTVPVKNSAVSADPSGYVLPFIQGETPSFTTSDGKTINLATDFDSLASEAVAKAKADNKSAAVIKLTPAKPIKFSFGKSDAFGYDATTLTFRDGTIATGQLINDKLTLIADALDLRSLPPSMRENSLAFDSRYLGEEWKKHFIANRERVNKEFDEEYGSSRDREKSATFKKHAYGLHIEGQHPPAKPGEHGGAETDAHAADHGSGHGHGAKVVVESKDITFFSNYTPKLNTYYAIYFTLTGLHGLHVVGGALVLLYFLLFNGRMMREDTEHFANRVEVGGLFWHFVDLVWIFLFPLLYLL
jgi:heme/copper-type cytochrome/quinol oxidase subunit 3